MRGARSGLIFAWLIGLGVVGAAGLGLAQEKTDPAVQAPVPATAAPSPEAAAPTASAPLSATAPPEEPTPPVNAMAEAAAEPPPAPDKPPEPLKRPRFASAILQATDKVTAETLRFEVRVGEPVRYKNLVLTVRACEGTAADEGFSDSIANVEVASQPQVMGRTAVAARQVFRGWMFAGSPSLHPVQHPSYDVWLIACKTASGPGASA